MTIIIRTKRIDTDQIKRLERMGYIVFVQII